MFKLDDPAAFNRFVIDPQIPEYTVASSAFNSCYTTPTKPLTTWRFYLFLAGVLKLHLVARQALRKSEAAGTTNAPLAQLAEQLTLNQWVRGSSP